jgi:hypothetical protein
MKRVNGGTCAQCHKVLPYVKGELKAHLSTDGLLYCNKRCSNKAAYARVAFIVDNFKPKKR